MANDTELEDQDTVIVTATLDYTPWQIDVFNAVNLYGEVNMPGTYLIEKGEMLNSLLKRAEGLKNTAFIQGAVIKRESVKVKQESILEDFLKDYEINILEEKSKLADSILTTEEREKRRIAIEYREKILKLMASRLPEGRIIVDLDKIIRDDSDI